jgi:hypothetical protein
VTLTNCYQKADSYVTPEGGNEEKKGVQMREVHQVRSNATVKKMLASSLATR